MPIKGFPLATEKRDGERSSFKLSRGVAAQKYVQALERGRYMVTLR